MKKSLFIFVLGYILFWATACFAHELSPAHYPLGPMPIFISIESWFFVAMVPITLAVETMILWYWARGIGINANLWRAALLYIIGRVTETAAFFSLGIIGKFFGWVAPGWTSSATETFGSLLFCLLVGIIFKFLIAMLLYRRTFLHKAQVLKAVSVASLAGYLSAEVWSLAVRAIIC